MVLCVWQPPCVCKSVGRCALSVLLDELVGGFCLLNCCEVWIGYSRIRLLCVCGIMRMKGGRGVGLMKGGKGDGLE